MLCSKCNQKEAVVAVTEVKNKQKVQIHLCADCAQNHTPCIEQPSFFYSVNTLLGQFLEALTAKAQEQESQIKCNRCGLSLNELRKTGRFGCEHDYDVFAEQLQPIMVHIHGANQHCGKVPAYFPQIEQQRNTLADLQQRLKAVIAEEQYEAAAQIRDEIRKLEEKKHGSDNTIGKKL